MKKWEYNCVSIMGLGYKTTKVLNEFGNEGWELVCAQGIRNLALF